MSTQHYPPQQSYPQQMPGSPRTRPAKFVPAPGQRHVIAVDTIPGRIVPSTFGVSEVVIDVEGGRPWYVPQVVADEIYRLGVRSGDQIEVTVTGRKKTDLLIVPLQPRLAAGSAQPQHAPPAGNNGHSNGYRNGTPIPPPPPPPPPATDPPFRAHSGGGAPSLSAASLRFMAAYKDAIDVLIEQKAYAQTRGLALEIHCEDVRCLAATMMIDQQKGGAR